MSKNQQRIRALSDSFGTWYEDKEKLKAGRMTAHLHPYTAMFSPIRINRLSIKNRLVMAPMGNINMAEETGRPNAKMIEYFTARAKGGVGLITSGLVPVSHGIDPSVTELDRLSYFPRIDRSRSNLAGWRDLAERCHVHGARFFIQLTPGLGRVGSPECMVNKLKMPVSASWNPNFYIPAIPCRPLSGRQARKIIKNTGQAAADAKAMTIDGVYLHGHEGYLLEQMTNPAFNRRKIGAYSNWTRFGTDLVREIRRRTGDAYPIMYRIDLSLLLNETYGEKLTTIKSLKKFRNERSVDQTLEYMQALVRAGVDLFDVDLGCYDNWWLPHPPGSMAPGCYLEVAQLVKEHFAARGIKSNAGQEVPVVAVGKLGYPDLAEQALRDEKCDMLMLGRPLLADPEWPNKAFAGRVSDITPCIGCQEGCINEFVEGGHPQCAVNPRTGFEDLYNGSELSPAGQAGRAGQAGQPKNVAVIGGGPAGIICALTAVQRGHQVRLYEAREEVGGMLIPGSQPAIKFDIINYLDYLRHEVAKAHKQRGLKLRTYTAPGADELKKKNFDVIVHAVGSQQSRPPVPGIDAENVLFAVDVLRNPALIGDSQNIVVVGGGVVGCETAYFLSQEKGRKVTVVEMLPHFMPGVCTANRGWLIHYLEQQQVPLLNCTRLKAVRGKEVLLSRNISRTVPDPYVTWAPLLPENIENPFAKVIKEELQDQTVPADLVILAAGALPDESLYRELIRSNAADDIRIIGDSFEMGKILEATRAAYSVGVSI
ncbi:MAG: FAD-dependent oxidoreductase [Spirochaetia bacterium]